VLKGTLVLPEGYSRKTPVLVMVTGSGLQNRDEEIYEHKPFAVIADALARNGIATLRYDDRGFGESTGDLVHCTTVDLKNDALAGIDLLRKRFDKVGVIGHSEGGTIALMLAAENKADFIVSLAGMVVSGKETLLWQNRVSLAAAGIPAETIDS
jgi:pimeloyl-ACP methyl ester carboxylesterase